MEERKASVDKFKVAETLIGLVLKFAFVCGFVYLGWRILVDLITKPIY